MDTTNNNQFEELYIQFKKLLSKIENSEVHTNPFPYILIEDGIDPSLTSEKIISMAKDSITLESNGRTSIVLPWNLPYMDELEHSIRSKFNLNL